jgi:hypothetical protein
VTACFKISLLQVSHLHRVHRAGWPEPYIRTRPQYGIVSKTSGLARTIHTYASTVRHCQQNIRAGQNHTYIRVHSTALSAKHQGWPEPYIRTRPQYDIVSKTSRLAGQNHTYLRVHQGSTLGAQIIRGYPEELLNNFGVPRNCF